MRDLPERPEAEQKIPALVRRAIRAFYRLKSRPRLFWGLVAGATSGVLLLLPLVHSASSKGRVLDGVRAAGRDVSSLDRATLENALAGAARGLSERSLRVRVSGKPFDEKPSALGLAIDVTATATRVLATGREGSLVSRFAGYYRRWVSSETVPWVARLERAKFAEVARGWEKSALGDRPFEGGFRVEGTSVTALPPRGGRAIALAQAEAAVLEALTAPNPAPVDLPLADVPAPLPAGSAEDVARRAQALVSAPITLIAAETSVKVTLSPAELGPVLGSEAKDGKLVLTFADERLRAALDKVRAEVELEPVDARFEIGPRDAISIVPSRAGRRIAWAEIPGALLSASTSPERSAVLPLAREPKPALDTREAEALGIRGLVSSFTTRHPCCEPRVDNIHRIADVMKGRILRPGETASLNALVGPRTKQNGFVPAPTIEEGEFVDSLGGGVSQFATTFFNALFHGGYEIVERQPHSYWFPRYPMGHEATLSWPKPDVIFKNDTDAGLLIETAYSGTSITVKIYGDNGGRKVKAHVSRRENVVEPAVEFLPNPALPPDEERVKEPGMIGWSVIVSRVITFADGKTREDRRRVTYKPRPKRVELHPCRIPKGEKGYTDKPCPEPEDVEVLESEAEG